jgi:hypothetical protein
VTFVTLVVVGVALLVFGAYVLIKQPLASGGLLRLPGGFEVRSERAGFGIIALGVVIIALGAWRGPTPGGATPTTSDDTVVDGGSIAFEDDFSTTDHNWRGGQYLEEKEAYKIPAVRGDVGEAVAASPENALTDADLRITVDAHRTGGTAQDRFGYGIFCRGDGVNSFYAFNVWENQATLAKRRPGFIDPIALDDPSPDVQAAVDDDSWKKLEATCTTSATVNGDPVVNLVFSVDDEVILRATDPDDCRKFCGPPLHTGSFGLRATLGRMGEPDDTLDVTFDDFEVREE